MPPPSYCPFFSPPLHPRHPHPWKSEQQLKLVGFLQLLLLFQPLSLLPSIEQLFLSFLPPCLYLSNPSMPLFKVHLLPSAPSPSLTTEQSPAVPREDLFAQGKKSLCHQRRRVNALYFNIGRNFFEDCLFRFYFSRLQETQTPVCVSGLASKKMELLLRCWIFFL